MYVESYVENSYVENEVLADDPVELVRLLYAKAIEKLHEAEERLASSDIPGRARAIAHASEIVVELQASLDFERGSEIAVNLARLYDYVQERLAEANGRQQKKPLVEARRLLTTLYEGWQELRGASPTLEAASVSVEAADSGARNWTL